MADRGAVGSALEVLALTLALTLVVTALAVAFTGRREEAFREAAGRTVGRRAAFAGAERRADDAFGAGRGLAAFFLATFFLAAGFLVAGRAAFFRDLPAPAPARRLAADLDAPREAAGLFTFAVFGRFGVAPFRLAIAWVLSVALTVSVK